MLLSRMHRLGIRPEQLASILTRLQQCPVVADSIKFMTHFANADDPQDAMTSQQLQLFNTITQDFLAEKAVLIQLPLLLGLQVISNGSGQASCYMVLHRY